MKMAIKVTEQVRDNASSKEVAAQSVERFKVWITDRTAADDWSDYIRAGKLNRTEIAKECSFGRSAWTQNDTLESELQTLEGKLRESGVLERHDASGSAEGRSDLAERSSAGPSDATSQVIVRRAISAKVRAEGRVKALEEQNATLRAEAKDLRDQLKKLKFQEQHLCETGRMLQL